MATEPEHQDDSKALSGAQPPFHKRFNIDLDVEEAIRRFQNRVFSIVPLITMQAWADDVYIHRKIAIKLGEAYYEGFNVGPFLQQDFLTCLRALEATYEALPEREKRQLSAMLGEVTLMSEIDIGIRWKDGVFLRCGAQLLDEELVNQPLHWLLEPQYKDVLQPFKKGLSDFLQSQSNPERLRDTVRDMYEALENMARIVCGNDQNLKANAEQFVSGLGLSPHYSKILKEHTEYAHVFRHAPKQGKTRGLPSTQEVEAFIYTTGLFLRLAIEKLASKQ